MKAPLNDSSIGAAFAGVEAPPVLGSYQHAIVTVGGNASISPIGATSGVTRISASTSANFKGIFSVDPNTGMVRVTDANPAGIYAVTVTAFNSTGSTSRTFTLTVQNGSACSSIYDATSAADVTTGSHPYSVAVGDFNNDGKQDVAVANALAGTVSIRLGDGAGGFTSTPDMVVGNTPVSVAVGDFNNDGNQDFAAAVTSDNDIAVRLGDGTGGFNAAPNVSTGSTPNTVAIGDFNNDGNLDLAVIHQTSISIRFGNGEGQFTGTTDIDTGLFLVGLAIADFNNDNKQDVLTLSGTASLLFLGDGAGGFTRAPDGANIGAQPAYVAAGDFNNDGNQDFAFVEPSVNLVAVRLGNGAGGFTIAPDVAVAGEPESLAIGDFDSDGHQDLAVGNFFSSTVSIRYGNGSGSFPGDTTFSVGKHPQSVAVGDFNNDGRLDFATANYHADTVSVRLGMCNATPTIKAVTGVSRQQGSPVSHSQIATVTDEGGNGNVTVSVTSANPSNGVTISNIVNTYGQITADIVADCTASDATFTLQASNGTTTITDTLSVAVQANTAPVLSYASPQTVVLNGSLNVAPASATDNGSIASYSVVSVVPALTNAPTVSAGGVVSITGAQPLGAHTVTIQATDNCGLTTNSSFTLNVVKVDQTISVGTHAPASAAFNSSFTVAATSSSGLPVTYSSSGSCSNNGATFTMTSGTGTCTVMYDQPGNADYNPAPRVIESVTAQKAGQTITLDPLADRAFGDPDFAINASASSGLSLSINSLGQCTVNGNIVHLTGAGSCTITVSQVGDANYSAAQVSQTFQVAKANQTITFDELSDKTYGDADFNVSATASSGLAVSFAASGQCTVTGSKVHITGAGSCTITASQAGGNNYAAATPVARSFSISKALKTPVVTSSANPSDFGQDVTFTATVPSAGTTPTGLIQFKIDGESVIGALALNTSGSASFSISSLEPNPHTVTAEYSGDSNYNASAGTLAGGQRVRSLPGFAISDVSITEGNAGTKGLVFTLMLSSPSNLTVSVDYATSDGTATAGSDYQATSGTFVFRPGETTVKILVVIINGDTKDEPDETFFLNLSNAQNAIIGKPRATATILNDDAPGVRFSLSNYSFSEGAGHGDITLTRSGDISNPISVDYTTFDQSALIPCQNNGSGSASDRCDYVTATGTLRFAANEQTKAIPLVLVDDAYLENPESLNIRLSNPKGATLSGTDTATITITDNDTQQPTQNPIENQAFFIRQQYMDFLGREPEQAGFDFWNNRMNNCPAGQTCDRIDTSLRFFQSDEFQERGFYVYRLYDAVLGRLPKYTEFVPEVARLNGAQTVAEQRLGKDAYLLDFMNKQEFRNLYGAYVSADGLTAADPAGFVNALCARAGITPANKQSLIDNLQNKVKDPAHTLEDFILTPEMSNVSTRYYDRGFITMQYFGYLRRDPEQAGFDFWQNQLIGPNAPHKGDYRFMVGGFLQSDEYCFRFALISHTP